MHRPVAFMILWALLPLAASPSRAEDGKSGHKFLNKSGLYSPLTEPPCSYASTQDRKRLIQPGDRALAWLRGVHNGGAIPIRLFLSAPRVINDTYGLFFYDPDGGYVAAYKKDYGYKFHGWRDGVMVVEGRDGSLWSALTGAAFEGPSKGQRLERLPSFVTEWSYWLMLHPESTTYDLFDGKKYPAADLPSEMCKEARESMIATDPRLDAMTPVMGVEVGAETMAFPLAGLGERACMTAAVGGEQVAVFWHGPTRSAAAYFGRLDDQTLSLYADSISPETAPMKDKETGTRWSMAGRGIDGALRGKELRWANSIECRWFAWAAEHPETKLYRAPAAEAKP